VGKRRQRLYSSQRCAADVVWRQRRLIFQVVCKKAGKGSHRLFDVSQSSCQLVYLRLEWTGLIRVVVFG
jgi:hypothetical protein